MAAQWAADEGIEKARIPRRGKRSATRTPASRCVDGFGRMILPLSAEPNHECADLDLEVVAHGLGGTYDGPGGSPRKRGDQPLTCRALLPQCDEPPPFEFHTSRLALERDRETGETSRICEVERLAAGEKVVRRRGADQPQQLAVRAAVVTRPYQPCPLPHR